MKEALAKWHNQNIIFMVKWVCERLLCTRQNKVIDEKYGGIVDWGRFWLLFIYLFSVLQIKNPIFVFENFLAEHSEESETKF